MQFELNVVPDRGSWIIRVGDRIMSGAATRAGAEKVARLAAESLRRAGCTVRLRVEAQAGLPAVDELIAADVQTAA